MRSCPTIKGMPGISPTPPAEIRKESLVKLATKIAGLPPTQPSPKPPEKIIPKQKVDLGKMPPPPTTEEANLISRGSET